MADYTRRRIAQTNGTDGLNAASQSDGETAKLMSPTKNPTQITTQAQRYRERYVK